MDKEFWDAFKATYPNIADRSHRHRLQHAARQVPHRAARQCRADGGAAADPRRRRIRRQGLLPGAEAGGRRLSTSDFWPGAMKSVTWDGKTYGIPTNNETMALIWNAKIFADAGLDPEKPPATWDDVVVYSKTIHDKLGIAGYGLVAKQNAGNTPFRFMPQLWAYGGGALDEAARRADLRDGRAQQRREQGRAAGVLRHVCARQVGAGIGADQHAGREPEPVHRRPARHDDRPPGRIRQDARSRQQGDRRRQGSRRRRGREHALRPDPGRPGAPRRGVRRLEHPRPQAGIRRRRDSTRWR